MSAGNHGRRASAIGAALVAAATISACTPVAHDRSTSPRSGPGIASGAPRTGRTYPAHSRIVSTTFWVGEVFDAAVPDGSQICSTYDAQWAYHYSGVAKGRVPATAKGCPGTIKGGCDGLSSLGGTRCDTQARTAANNYYPTSAPRPRENPFYLDLPFDDLNDPTGFATRCAVIPWANDPGYAGHCTDRSFSYLKNRWVKITGPNGRTCYGQNEDAGPSHDDLYHDTRYVFGSADERPAQTHFNNAGLDVSPALNGCLGYRELNGDHDQVNWQFIDTRDVPPGAWKTTVTTSAVTT